MWSSFVGISLTKADYVYSKSNYKKTTRENLPWCWGKEKGEKKKKKKGVHNVAVWFFL